MHQTKLTPKNASCTDFLRKAFPASLYFPSKWPTRRPGIEAPTTRRRPTPVAAAQSQPHVYPSLPQKRESPKPPKFRPLPWATLHHQNTQATTPHNVVKMVRHPLASSTPLDPLDAATRCPAASVSDESPRVLSSPPSHDDEQYLLVCRDS